MKAEAAGASARSGDRTKVCAPRVVLDTNVCLDLFVFADPRVAPLDAALRGGVVAAVTREDCREEWRRVLRYPVLGLDEAACTRYEAAFDARIVCLAEPELSLRPQIRLPRCKDVDDQKFLELAWQAGASALVTRDDALLALARRARREGMFVILTPQDWSASPAASEPTRTQGSPMG